MLKFLSECEADTEKIGERLGERFKPGSIVAMYGDLGAGKTAFVRGVARGMGFDGRVTSPTYSIANEYDCQPPLFHFDLYRLSSGEDLYDIGFEEYLSRNGVCIMEWYERAEDTLEWDVCIQIDKVCSDDEKREITIQTQRGMADEDFSD